MADDLLAQVKRTERGYAAHYICAHYCLFRRNTLLECDETGVRVVVSSVGNMRPPGTDGKFPGNPVPVGSERYYETKAFYAVWEEPYWEADVDREISVNASCSLNEMEHDSDKKADEMHERVVKAIGWRMLRGDKLEIT